MKKGKIIIIVSIIVIMAIALSITVFFRFDSDNDAKPDTGLYFLNSIGEICLTENETVKLPLKIFFYNAEKTNDIDILDGYSSLSLITSDGNNILIENDEKLSTRFLSCGEKGLYVAELYVDLSYHSYESDYSITGFSYRDEKGNTINHTIGEIVVKNVTVENRYCNCYCNKEYWISFSQPVMQTYFILFDSPCPSSAIIEAVCFDLDDIKTTGRRSFEDCLYLSEKYDCIDYTCAELSVSLMSVDVPTVYYFKPLVRINEDGNIFYSIQENVMTQFFIESENAVYYSLVDMKK